MKFLFKVMQVESSQKSDRKLPSQQTEIVQIESNRTCCFLGTFLLYMKLDNCSVLFVLLVNKSLNLLDSFQLNFLYQK